MSPHADPSKVTPIGRVRGRSADFTIGNGGAGFVTEDLKAKLTAIQRCEAPDPHGWVEKLF